MNCFRCKHLARIVRGGVFLLALAVALASCSDLFSRDDDDDGKSYILLQLPGSFRSAQEETTRYTVTFRHAAGAEWSVTGTPGQYITSGEIPVGVYGVEAVAYNSAGTAIGMGEKSGIVVLAGQATPVTLTMVEIPEIDWNFELPSIELPSFSGGGSGSTGGSGDYEVGRLEFSMSEDEFRSAVNSAIATGGVVYLTGNVHIGSDLSITSAITIDGQGKYFICADFVTLAFQNVTFRNCYNKTIKDIEHENSWCGGFGGALQLGECTATLTNCKFINNKAGLEGGAIVINNWVEQGTVTITGCTFQQNTVGSIVDGAPHSDCDIEASGQYLTVVLGGGNSSTRTSNIINYSANATSRGTW